MPFELKLAFKYFRARRKSLARFTAFVAVVGIAAGVASLIIAQALANGFSDEMRDKILVNTAHISISLIGGTEIHNWLEIKTKLQENKSVTKIIPTAYESAILVSANGNNYAILRTENQELENENQNQGETWNYE
ncbi:MAG TPA: hypothetical protein VGD05_02530, partial [Pyrinomonadaceae bacterium]